MRAVMAAVVLTRCHDAAACTVLSELLSFCSITKFNLIIYQSVAFCCHVKLPCAALIVSRLLSGQYLFINYNKTDLRMKL